MCEKVSEDWWDNMGNRYLVFDSVEKLNDFTGKCATVMEKVEQNSEWDLISIPSKFYSEFNKQSDLNLSEFFSKYEIGSLESDYGSICVGKAFELRKLLVREFHHCIPNLNDLLYISSTATDKALDKQDVMSTETLERDIYKNLNVHCTLTLKITLENRSGYLLFEMAVYNTKPAIIMQDNRDPSSRVLNLPYGRIALFKCVDKNYAITVIKSSNRKKADVVFITYVAKAFLRPDFAIKYYNLFYVKFPLIFKCKREGDRVLAAITLKTRDNEMKIRTKDSNDKVAIKTVSFDYFKIGSVDYNIENAIRVAASEFQINFQDFRNNLKSLCCSLLNDSYINLAKELMGDIRGLRCI